MAAVQDLQTTPETMTMSMNITDERSTMTMNGIDAARIGRDRSAAASVRLRPLLPLLFSLSIALLVAGCVESTEDPGDAGDAVPAGGATTIYTATSNAFSMPAPNLSGENLKLHLAGDVDFESEFVGGRAEINGGLGPVFNSNSCISCHVRDGRGRPPGPGEKASQLLLRISRSGTDGATGGPAEMPGYGTQFLDKSLFGRSSHGSYSLEWIDEPGHYGDGESYSLRRPRIIITSSYRSFDGDLLISPRIPPPVFGDGLLEAISEGTIREMADPNDADGDGISGRVNMVWNEASSSRQLGRFGWKANTPTLLQQNAAAFRNDMGITSPYFPIESAHGTELGDPDDGLGPDVSMDVLIRVTRYVQTLGVPARRNTSNPDVIAGERLFSTFGCASCHRPTLTTGTLEGLPEVSNQKIAPYTDLLIHDMGEGLSDNRPDYQATGREWRTPPLWGIGLTSIVNGHTMFLHDGRARSIAEAILWHGGEGERARESFRTASKRDRDALVRFVESL